MNRIPNFHSTHLRLIALAVFSATLITSAARAETVIAFWDFNDGFAVPDETVQIVHTATIGNGTLYQQRADTDGNGKTGVAFNDAGLGITAMNNQSNVAIRLDDFRENSEMRIDNVLVTGITAIPEPASAGLLWATAGLVVIRRRRR